jgi:DivIVA domain-containing protein
MIDESFHLTPLDVRRYEFNRALRGYDSERVDQFRDQVAEELERLGRLNLDLEEKNRTLGEQLRSFIERDKAINEALVSAHELRTQMRGQAEKECELLLRETRAEAAKIIEEARAQVRKVEEEFTALDRMRRGYLTQLRMHAERHLAEVAAAEAGNGDVKSRADG